MWRFPGKTFILLPIILWNIDVRNYGGSKSVCWVWKTYRYVDTKNTFLRHWGANIWLATLQWWPLWILSSGSKRTRRNSGDFKYVTQVAFKMQSPKFHLSPIFIQSKLLILLDFYFLKYEDHQLMTEFFKGQCMTGVATNTRGGHSFRKQVHALNI